MDVSRRLHGWHARQKVFPKGLVRGVAMRIMWTSGKLHKPGKISTLAEMREQRRLTEELLNVT